MNRTIVATLGLCYLMCVLSVGIANAQDAGDANPPTAESEAASPTDLAPAGETAQETPLAVSPPRKTSKSRARGLRMDQDGFVEGQVVFIDPHSLDQVPVAGAIVTFIQQRHIIAQTKTGVDGMFFVEGLSPYATYSMFVRSSEWMAVMGTYVNPVDEKDDEQTVQADANKFVFASLQDNQEQSTMDSATGDAAFQAIQVVPLQDFLAAVQLGILPCPGNPPAPNVPAPVGGGGGSAGGGYGAGAAAAFAAAAAAWGAGAGNEDGELASPFAP